MLVLLGALEIMLTNLRIAAARLGAVGVLVAIAVVSVDSRVGPVVVIFSTGHGLHALDVLLIVVGVPCAVALLRYAERLREDHEDEARSGRFWERWG